MRAPEIIIKLIQGYRIPFFQKPPLVYPNVIKNPFQTPVSEVMSGIVQDMKKQGILKVAPNAPSFISPLFLVPKSDGSLRPIFNLRALNEYVIAKPFHLININRIPDFLQHQDWMCKVDLSQAYFHLQIKESQRRFLRIIYNQELLEMTCLPFGLSSAPRTFSILTNWLAQSLREKYNIRILVYLDDFLIAHQNVCTLQEHVELAVKTLQKLGWRINFEKSIICPQKSITYLGVLWDPWKKSKISSERKNCHVNQKIKSCLRKKKAKLKGIAERSRCLEFCQFCCSKRPAPSSKLINVYEHCIKAPTEDAHLTRRSPARVEVVDSQLPVVDAPTLPATKKLFSYRCIGPSVESTIEQYGSLGHLERGRASSILIQSDNKTAVAHLRKEGGTKSKPLMEITYKILNLLDRHQIHFSIHYIPGKHNNHADHLSCHRHPPEWHLLPSCVETVFAKWGTPVIDLFASKMAHVVYNYVSRDVKDTQALFHDAFSTPWNYPLAWVFPPPFLVPKVLAHLNQSTGIFLLVVPRWEKVFWRADLKVRALAAPMSLKNLQNHLVDTSTGHPPPNVENIILEVWKCGGGPRR
ncbi:unnamed protein product [Parnassius mnemosyne]|uniref:Reverse transcriptase domain-containing protein n=1 Tax=Parnassius mnemosyne TaxID=213953 RepID=A0AAV1LSU2_9NEOP